MFLGRVSDRYQTDPQFLWLYYCGCFASLLYLVHVHVDVNGGVPTVSNFRQSPRHICHQIYFEDCFDCLG
jgi:hypothetical protein